MSFTLTAVSKLIPSNSDSFDEYRAHENVRKNKFEVPADQTHFNDAIELNIESESSRSLEIKNEDLGRTNLSLLN